MVEAGKIITLLIGHESFRLDKSTSKGHTHRWNLFIRPTNREFKEFEDNKFISKIKFGLHYSFDNPSPIIREPPFVISETGYASFTPEIQVFFNLPNHKTPHILRYELNLSLDDTGYHEEVQTIVIKSDVPSSFSNLIHKYCVKKKSKRKSSLIDEKTPPEKRSKKEEKRSDDSKKKKESKKGSPKERHTSSTTDKHKEKHSKHSHISSKDSSSKNHAKEKEREKEKKNEEVDKKKYAPSKEYAADSLKNSSELNAAEIAEDLTEKISKISDHYVLYKISQFMLSIPNTTLSEETLTLSFDLSSTPKSKLLELSKLFRDITSSTS